MGRAFAFAANAEQVNVVAHEISDIDERRFVRKRGEANPSAAIEHARGFVDGAGAPEHSST